MAQNNYTYIEELIERFFEGNTSNKEEEELYSFFSQEDIPEHLKKYQQVFFYFTETIEQEISVETHGVRLPAESDKDNNFTKIRWWIPLLGIAATILLFFILPFTLDTQEEHNNKDWQGSYIIQNGKKITEIELIASDLQSTILLAEQKHKDMENKVSELFLKEEQAIQKMNLTREINYEQIVNKLFTGQTQKEVLKLLEDQE